MKKHENFDDIVKKLMKEPKTYSFHLRYESSISLYYIKYLRMKFKEKNTGKIVEMAIDHLYKEIQEKGKEYIEMKVLNEKVKIYIENSIPKDINNHDKEKILNDLSLLTNKIEKLYQQQRANTATNKNIRNKRKCDNTPSLFENLNTAYKQ